MPNLWYQHFESAKKDGTLPNKSNAQAMRYKKTIIWKVDLSTSGLDYAQRKGEWTITITSADGSQIYFQQTVGLTLLLVSLGTKGLELFTWNYVKDEFNTTFVAGSPTTKESVGDFLLGKTAASEQGDAEPASGYDSTNETATITLDWYSPIYLLQSPGRQLPVGYRVKTSKDSWGLGNAVSTYQYAFDEGTASMGSTFDGLGALLTATAAPDGERIFTGRAWPGNEYAFRDVGGAVKGSYPTLHELRDGRELMTLLTSEGVIEVVSRNSEWNWERVQYPDAKTGKTSTQAIFGPDADMPLSILLEDDTRLCVVTEGSNLYSRTVDDAGLGEKVFVGAKGDGVLSLERSPTGEYLILGNTGLPIYKTTSLPPRWVPIKAAA